MGGPVLSLTMTRKEAPEVTKGGKSTKGTPAPRRSARILVQRKPVEGAAKAAGPPTKKTAPSGIQEDSSEPGVREDSSEPGVREDSSESDIQEDSSESDVQEEEENEQEDRPRNPLDMTIGIGDTIPPHHTLKNEKDEDIQVSALTAEEGLVLFIVAKANAPACTVHAHGFRDLYPNFTSLGYNVYCLSTDLPSVQIKWQTTEHLPFHLLSDPEEVLIRALTSNGMMVRSHFIFEKGGKLLGRKTPVEAVNSPKLALEFVNGLSVRPEDFCRYCGK